jgi:RNA exonuclease 4
MRAKRKAEEQQLGSAREAATAAVKNSRAHSADASAGSAPPALPPPISSNWAALQSAMLQQQAVSGRKPYRKRAADAKGAPVVAAVPDSRPQSIGGDTAPTRVVGLDCEMVGVGLDGQRSVLARCVAGGVFVRQHRVPIIIVTALVHMQGVCGEQCGQCVARSVCASPGASHRLPHQSQR